MRSPAGTRTLLIAGIGLLTAAVLVLTYRQVPLYTTFYGYTEKPAGSVAVRILLVLCLCALTVLVLRKTVRAWAFLAGGVVIGAILQFGFAYTEGRGLEGIRGRAHAGHGQFIEVALATDDAVGTLRQYESLAARGKLEQFPRSKPPGTLLFYVLNERVSRLFVAHTYDERRRWDRFVDFLAVTWPFVAALAILPLYWIATLLAGPAEARMAAGLYLLVPSFNLVTLHTDQVLFPSLFLSVLALFVWSLQATDASALLARGAATGAALCVAAFCSFPLALAIGVGFGLWLAAWVTDTRPAHARVRSAAVLAGSLTAGLVVPSLGLLVMANYNPIVRWHAALEFHAAWRGVPAVVGFSDGIPNIAEFIDWTGIPICVMALAVFSVSRRHRDDRRRDLSYMALMASLIGIVAYLAFFSRTVAETARLWIFLMPVLCLTAARTMSELRKTHRQTVPIMFALQFATVYVIKMTHDFW